MSCECKTSRNYFSRIKISESKKMHKIKIPGREFDSFYIPMREFFESD